jgi:hypothetical protein
MLNIIRQIVCQPKKLENEFNKNPEIHYGSGFLCIKVYWAIDTSDLFASVLVN